MSSNILNIFLCKYFSLYSYWYLTDTGEKRSHLFISFYFLPYILFLKDNKVNLESEVQFVFLFEGVIKSTTFVE